MHISIVSRLGLFSFSSIAALIVAGCSATRPSGDAKTALLTTDGCPAPSLAQKTTQTAPVAAPESNAGPKAEFQRVAARTPASGETQPEPRKVLSGNGKRFYYTPRPYPVDERGFSPVDENLEKAYAREEMIADDTEASLNPYVLRVLAAYPLDGSYPYHCSWKPREYDIYNGVTQDMWYKGMVVAKAYPDGSRCSYCCGYTFEVFLRAMKLRNVQKGLDPDDFNGMTFNDLFNMLQLWYIEGKGDSEQRAVTCYGLGRAITNFDDAKPGDFLSYSTTPPGGHSVVFMGWLRDDDNKIVGLKYFSSNLSGTHGVGNGQAHFSDANHGRGVLRKSLRIVRVGALKDYAKFDRSQIPQRNAYAPTQPDRIIYVPAPPQGTALSSAK